MLNAILRLVRIQNLLIIAVTQYLMRWCILKPFLKINNFDVQLGGFNFFLLVLSTVLIAAAGYIINDYFDTRTDRLNRPEAVVIDRRIPRRLAIFLHTLFNIVGVGIGVYLSFYISVPELSLIFLLASGFLWFYSTNYKRQFLIGNMIVSLLTGAVPILVILFEMPLLNKEYGEIMIKANSSFNYIFFWIAGFSFFAFLTTLIREIIKDAEDFEGDSAFGMNTLPIMIGTFFTKIILGVLIVALILTLAWVAVKYIIFSGMNVDYVSAVYFLGLLIIPGLILILKIAHAKNKHDYHIASQIIKGIMMGGVLYSLVVRYIVMNQII